LRREVYRERSLEPCSSSSLFFFFFVTFHQCHSNLGGTAAAGFEGKVDVDVEEGTAAPESVRKTGEQERQWISKVFEDSMM